MRRGAALAVGLAVAVTGCESKSPARDSRSGAASASATPPLVPATAEVASAPPSLKEPLPRVVPDVELTTGGARAEERLPLVIAIHGYGDSPRNFASLFASFTARARVLLPHSETPAGDGYSWFPLHGVGSPVDAPKIAATADALVAFAADAARRRATAGKPIFTGFSQGGALSYTIALRHPDAIAAALPVSGWLPRSLLLGPLPKANVPVFAFHGTADPRVPLTFAHEAKAALDGLGYSVNLTEFPDVPHAIPETERSAIFAALANVCAAQK